MAGEWQIFWYLLAGFVLGFAASTLWEWLYFRGHRLRAAAPLPEIREAEAQPKVVTSAWNTDTAYRSPAIFLEGEQPAFEPAQPPPSTTPTPDATPPDLSTADSTPTDPAQTTRTSSP
jgi:hypothetical protein